MDIMQYFLVLALFCGLAVCDDRYDGVIRALRYYRRTPAFTYNSTVRVGLSLDLVHVREVDEAKGEVELVAYFQESWNDPRLAWEPTSTEGIGSVRLDIGTIWMPDIVAYNQVTAAETLSPEIAIVEPNGQILHVPSQRFRFQCDLKAIATAQGSNCTIKFGSWTHASNEVDVFITRQPSLVEYTGDSRFTILGVSAERNVTIYPCCSETFPYVSFTFTLKKEGQGAFSWMS